MKTSPFDKVSVSIPLGKKSKFNLNHDVNTTYDWGSVQPLFGKLMLPDSSININAEQLTRLAPMVVPTFGRVKLKNIVHFVPCQEIWPNWDPMMSQTKVTRSSNNSSGGPTTVSYVPRSVPFINNNILAMFCLVGAKVNLYYSGIVGTSDEDRWICTNNSGPFANPTPNSAMTYAARDYLNIILRISNTASPSTTTISDFKYVGYEFNPRKIVLDKSTGEPLLNNTGYSLGILPTISTMVCQALPNANHNGFTHSANNEDRGAGIGGANVNLGPITFDGSDIIWEYAGSTGTGILATDRTTANNPLNGISSSDFDGRKIRLVFKFSSFGKRLRKILIGLGYDVNLANDDKVSILPLVAFYKSWWDSYAPERYRNFYETAAWKLINAAMSTPTGVDLLACINSSAGTSMLSVFKEFMSDLGTCFATEKMDCISASTDNYYGGSSTTQSVNGITSIQSSIITTIREVLNEPRMGGSLSHSINADGSTNVEYSSTANGVYPSMENGISMMLNVGNIATNGSPHLTQPQIDALKKAYVMMNKSSVAGMKVADILRSLGFGDYVEECSGKFVSSSDDSIKISDVVATAATSDAELGQYGGRGLGFGKFQFSFKTNRHGYMIVLSAIVPESGYVNAPAHENEAIDFASMFNPEFDGLAYEAVQKKQLVGSPLVSDATYHQTFGFLPTYSQWKFMSNKANGDFSLNSRKQYMTPYTLDKIIPVSNANVYDSHVISSGTNQGSTEIDCSPLFKYSDLPNAGEDWRYVNKYPWNGDFNRIFSEQDDGYEWSVFSPNNNSFLYNSFEFDNFMTHTVFEVAYYAHMKPIEDSYGTYDQEHGAPNASVSRA